MSRALIASTGSRRLSREGSTNSPHIQSARLDEQPPPENDALRPADDEEICRPSVLKPSLGILNTGLPKPSNPQEQKSTSNILPDDSLAAEAQTVVVQEDQPNLSELVNVMKQVLDVLLDSTIASKSGKDDRSRFWGLYRRVAEEHDNEFLERYTSDMDIVLVFSGLLSWLWSPISTQTRAIPRMPFSRNLYKSDSATSLRRALHPRRQHLLGCRPKRI